MAPTLKDVFNSLKTTIVGVQSKEIDTKLDKAVQDISIYKSTSGRNGYVELVRSLIAKVGQVDMGGAFFQTQTTPAALGQGSRLMRYKSYEAIVQNINYCFRALTVLTDNILSPDDITKTSLEVKSIKFIEDEPSTDSKAQQVREMIEEVKLEQKLNLIVKNTLKFGDYFCEIGDAKTALTSRAILQESWNEHQDLLQRGIKERLEVNDVESKKTVRLLMDYSSFEEKKKEVKPKDVHLLFYEPKRVVKLQSDMFPLCFGYLVFPEAALSPHLAIQNQLVNSICATILKSLEKKLPQMGEDIFSDKELKDIISSMIIESDFSRAMNIRYVSPDKMVHFNIPSTKYYPYGESIYDASQFTAKVLIALETALTIHRINRSTEKRKITVDIGLPRDSRKAIEKLKEEFRKRKISLDAFGSVDTIPSMITTFEDVYIPTKDGKAFVDISTFTEGMVDIRSKVDELRFMRDSVVASLGVPASFLNIEENLSNKSALSEENILFARTIVNHQKYFGHQIEELLEKIYSITDPEKGLKIMEEVNVEFPVPRSLQFERESKYMSDLANLVETLGRLGIPLEYAKKKYLPDIKWEEVKKHEIDQKIDQNLKTEPPTGPVSAGMGPELGLGGLPGGELGGLGGGGLTGPGLGGV